MSELVELQSPLEIRAEQVELQNKVDPHNKNYFARITRENITAMWMVDMMLQWVSGGFCTTFVYGEPGKFKSSGAIFISYLQTQMKIRLIERGMAGRKFGIGTSLFDKLGLDYDYRPTFTIKDNLRSRLTDFIDLIGKAKPLSSNQADEILEIHGKGADITTDMAENLLKSLRALQIDMTLVGVEAPSWPTR